MTVKINQGGCPFQYHNNSTFSNSSGLCSSSSIKAYPARTLSPALPSLTTTLSNSQYSTRELGHGREEIRNYLMLSDISNQIDSDDKWKNLKSIGMVESVRTENGHEFRLEKMGQASNNTSSFELLTNQSTKPAPFFKEYVRKTTVETRYYICSLNLDAKKFGNSVRNHWGYENSLHWILDVALNEDDCRIRKDNAPQNFAVLRHIAVNLLSQ